MQPDDDIAFQHAILAAPNDVTLKLVYADWLQDRDDPRAGYLRLKVELDPTPAEYYHPEDWKRWEPLHALGRTLDRGWVGFMLSLAHPFAPRKYQVGDPFTEPIGERGELVVFGSQYRTAETWNEGLMADLGFLTGVGWGECFYGQDPERIHGFLCDLGSDNSSLEAVRILEAIKYAEMSSAPAEGARPLVSTNLDHQFLFPHENDEDARDRPFVHTALKDYVTGGRLWVIRGHPSPSQGTPGGICQSQKHNLLGGGTIAARQPIGRRHRRPDGV